MILRAEHQAGELAQLLVREGAEPVIIPVIRIIPPQDWSQVDDALQRLDEFEWIVFTSVNGANLVLRRLNELRASGSLVAKVLDLRPRVAAIGPATRGTLEKADVNVDWTPSAYTSEALAQELPEPAGKVLLIRAEVAPTQMEESLRRRGFSVERVNAYRTEATGAPGLVEVLPTIDAIAFTSAWIVRCFAEAAAAALADVKTTNVSIGPATSAACRQFGIKVDVEATEQTLPGLVRAMRERLSR